MSELQIGDRVHDYDGDEAEVVGLHANRVWLFYTSGTMKDAYSFLPTSRVTKLPPKPTQTFTVEVYGERLHPTVLSSLLSALEFACQPLEQRTIKVTEQQQ